MKSAIIFCNGNPVNKKIILKIIKKYKPILIGADGGSNHLYKYKLNPDYIIGDLDSINSDVKNYFQNKGIKIIKISRQNDTDLEKALKLCKKLRLEKIFIAGFSGKRFDHTLSNISNALKFTAFFEIVMIENFNSLQFVTGERDFLSEANELISILCFNPKTKITTFNLKYPLKNEKLFFGERESTSNVSLGKKFKLIVKNGFALLMRTTKNFLKYDLPFSS